MAFTDPSVDRQHASTRGVTVTPICQLAADMEYLRTQQQLLDAEENKWREGLSKIDAAKREVEERRVQVQLAVVDETLKEGLITPEQHAELLRIYF